MAVRGFHAIQHSGKKAVVTVLLTSCEVVDVAKASVTNSVSFPKSVGKVPPKAVAPSVTPSSLSIGPMEEEVQDCKHCSGSLNKVEGHWRTRANGSCFCLSKGLPMHN